MEIMELGKLSVTREKFHFKRNGESENKYNKRTRILPNLT